ncbi:hypothetical protein [Saccharopolyspora cebuensis]|uniref:hypothetical protein n=1 Tax=Saccharopolyspora cebuensis TaxID=418759 RepID=UPI0031E6BDB7
MELFEEIRRDARRGDAGVRELARRHGVHRRTVWARTFTDPRLRAAIIDRLTFARSATAH